MKQGHFYFISDQFYKEFDPDKKLMQNKETLHGKLHSRPCFYAFQDWRNAKVYWCVPVSSKVEKYKNIVQLKLAKQTAKGVLKPYCNTIVFASIMGRERTFLIQNMFPITEKYITEPYINKITKSEVRIEDAAEKEIIRNATTVLKLSFRGVPVLFTNVTTIYNELVAQLGVEIQKPTPEQTPTKKPSVHDRLEAAKAQTAQRDTGQGSPQPQHKKNAPER